MKISEIKTYVLKAELENHGFGWSQRVTDRRQTAICEVVTDRGISGLGEAFYFGGPADIAAAIMKDALGPLLIGKDPFDTCVIWDSLYNYTRDQGMKGLTLSAISGIDIALWDIKGKALGLPVYKLLGGAYRNRARVYATGLYEPQNASNIADALAQEALGYKKEGFTGMKLKIGYGIRTDLKYIKAVREAIGEDLYLMVDANHAYNAAEAIRLAREMERFDIYWFEEPVPPEDVDGYLEVKQNSSILITGGECEYTRYGFRELINRRAVDILQPDLCATGGFSEMMKIIAMASAANVPVIPHVWGTNVGLAASLQLFAALPHFPERRFPQEPFFEYDRSPHPLRQGVTREKFVTEQGYLKIPDGPGLGVSLDMDFIKKYTAR
ncbi:MAG: mandelate racemase/muconate lactonizing enzyme family protein [Deltaproteobacteria bacterium]|nr:mandelate racemase/muconate lactonizing enzyme family protein [Deltaproteobacteria bacterium]MBW2151742.1 mandelate racemase/muconate lactonizing enzyme family protein [Deltaproteobacteria bacterium]